LFPGGHGIDQGAFSGVRVQLGAWLNDCGTVGVDGSYLHLFRQSVGFNIRSDGVPVIGRAFTDVGSGRDIFLLLSTTEGVERGFISVNAPTEMQTADVNLRVKGSSFLSDRVDYLWGFRYLRLRESIDINSGV